MMENPAGGQEQQPPPQANEPDNDQARRLELEAEARKQRWKPLDEFEGDPKAWIDAEEWIRRGDPRYLREELDKSRSGWQETQQRLARLEQERAREKAQHQQDIEGLRRMNEITLERQRDQILAQIESQKEVAVDTGNTETYRQLRQAEHEVWQQDAKIRQQFRQPEPPQRQQQQQQDVPPEVQEWVGQNKWFEQDPVLNLEAQAIHTDLAQRAPYMPIAENLRQVAEEVKRRYPQKFGIRPQQQNGHARSAMPQVEAGGRMAASPSGGMASKLSAAARAQAERDVTNGYYKNLEEWAKVYFEGGGA